METQTNLNFISVNYQDGTNEPFYDVNKRKYFTDSLANHHLSDVNSIFVQYQVNLKIEHTNDRCHWRVSKNGEPFFSFTCENEKEFMTIFERHLQDELCERFSRNQPPFASYEYPAKLS